MTMKTVRDAAGLAGDRRQLVFLPGADMTAEDFRRHGFFDAVREAGVPADMVAVETGVDRYFDDVVAGDLHDQIVMPAEKGGPLEIWLVGISLGGMGALRYIRAYPDRVAGAILLAPFIGTRGTVHEIEAAGGWAKWKMAIDDPGTREQRLLAWIAAWRSMPRTILGYGRDDRFARAHRLLAELLPQDRVLTMPGGHDWETWGRLWRAILAMQPFENDREHGAAR